MISVPFSPKATFASIALIPILLVVVLYATRSDVGAQLHSTGQPSSSPIDQTGSQDLTIIRSDDSGLIIEVAPPKFLRTEFQSEKGQFDQIRIPGYGYLGIIGWPDLPQRSALMALPPGAEAQISVLAAESYEIQGIKVLSAAQQNLLNGDPDTAQNLNDFSPEFGTTYPMDSLAYGTDELFPQLPVTLGDEHWLRDLRVMPILIRPCVSQHI